MHRYWPIYAFDSGGAGYDQQQTDRGESLVDKPTALYCHHCLRLICFTRQATRINGQHQHVRTNPAGFTYHIACYADAPGCKAIGTPTFDDTWFAAYQWQITVCIDCQCHLGWRFTAMDTFFGLISSRLIQDAAD